MQSIRVVSRNFFEIKIILTKDVTILSEIYLNYFVSKIALSKELEGKYVLDVYFSRKDILRSAYKLPRKINSQGWQKKMPSLEFYDQ